jgi:pimeloyl-ACP methyl ester carboxylesterase
MPLPPVLLVHGFASSFERNWREPGWVDLLTEAGRRVVGPDLLGHGTAAKPHDPAAYGALPDTITDALDTEGTVDAIGFSMGAALLLGVAADRPDRFRRLVVAGIGGGVFRAQDPERTERVARAVESGRAEEGDPPLAGAFARFATAPGNDPAALAACLRRGGEPLRPARLASVTIPVLVVLGDRDPSGPAHDLVDALPDARLVTLAGTDHFATPKDFRFVGAALDFLEAS